MRQRPWQDIDPDIDPVFRPSRPTAHLERAHQGGELLQPLGVDRVGRVGGRQGVGVVQLEAVGEPVDERDEGATVALRGGAERGGQRLAVMQGLRGATDGGGWTLGVARFTDASIYHDTFPAIRIAILLFIITFFFFVKLFSFRQKRHIIIISTCDFCKVIPQINI